MMADDLLFNIAVLVGGYWVFPVCCLPYGTDFCETVLCHTDNFGVGKAWWKSLNVLEFWVWNGVWTLLITLCIISTLSEITVKCYTLTGISVYKLYIMKTIVHSRCLCLVCNVQDTFTCLWMTDEGKSCTWLHVLQCLNTSLWWLYRSFVAELNLFTGEKEFIDCGHLGLDVFSALKDEFKVNILTVLAKLCMFSIFFIVHQSPSHYISKSVCIRDAPNMPFIMFGRSRIFWRTGRTSTEVWPNFGRVFLFYDKWRKTIITKFT